ncbi:signal peptidase 22 kDa subunit [Nadsonia fulvescens var. elongata DSM 6958]|uniref:Signal peptidase subunit 3 n=1 Tax=Nadsonia fulvescens var. elongata DSM 6958 TaxID=857566 RepID=A0A1E3PIG0_9ASCO|nr:signal peptidase 22 kDa subunit [Nadsonia fulvescens var. elongata DSM 6958]
MFSATQRLQNVFGHFTSVFLMLAAAIMLLSYTHWWLEDIWELPMSVRSVEPKILMKYSRRFGGSNNQGKENCKLKVDFDGDLTPLFNWNTKQLFVYLTAEYDGDRPDISNKVIFWDQIITDKKDAVLDYHNLASLYSVYDTTNSFNQRNATIRLEWNIQPYVGWLIYGETVIDGIKTINFPAVEGAKKRKTRSKK